LRIDFIDIQSDAEFATLIHVGSHVGD